MILTNNLNGGGAEKVLLTLLNHLSPIEYEIELALVFKTGVYLTSIPSHVKTRYIFDDNINASELISHQPEVIYETYLKNDCDVEIAFLEGNATKILSRSTNKVSKKIAWVHIDLNQEHYTKKIYANDEEELSAYNAFNQIVFVSNGALAGFELLFGNRLHERSIVVYNPIDTTDVLQKAKEALTARKDKITLCTVGRLAMQKGYANLIRAVNSLLQQGYDFNLWILGEGQLEQELKELCIKLKIEKHVTFWGFQTNPYKFMNAADVFVCSSRAEGLSLVIGEALALKKPVVSTKCSGPMEVLSAGKWGQLVEISQEGLYFGIKNYLDNPMSIPVLTNETMEIYNNFYGLDNYVDRIKKLIG